VALIAGFFILGLLTRIPFASRLAYLDDSARFALAMEHFDVAQMRPHAPGYILYVALAKLVDLLAHDPVVSLVSVSVVANAATVCLLYHVASVMFGRTSGLVASVLLLTSPLFWFNGEMPLTYALEGLLSVAFAWACYEFLGGRKAWLPVAALLLALATGVRQNAALLLFPLWLYSMKRCSPKQILVSFFIFGATCTAWLIPMVALTGGVAKYFGAMNAQFNAWVLSPLPLIVEVAVRTKILLRFLCLSLCLGSVAAVYYLGRMFSIPAVIVDVKRKFLLLWILPAVVFFVAVNVWNPGHVVLILPPLFIVLAESVKGVAADVSEGVERLVAGGSRGAAKALRQMFSYRCVLISSVLVFASTNAAVFLLGGSEVSLASIREGDRQIEERIRLTRERFSAGTTMILTCDSNTQAGLYLPDYLVCCPFPLIFSASDLAIEAQNVYLSYQHETTPKTYWIPTGFRIEPIEVPRGIETLVLWEEETAEYYQTEGRVLGEIESEKSDARIFYLRLEPDDKIYYDYQYLNVG
jgi:hypothetical protein